MAHPFFSAIAFPFFRPEAKAFLDALSRAVPAAARIQLLYEGCGPALPPLNYSDAKSTWLSALQNLVAARALKNLCDAVLLDNTIAAVHDTVRAILKAEDSLEKTMFGEDVLFVDRKGLRAHLRKLEPVTGTGVMRILLVRGGPASGKSWTRKMVEDVAATIGEPCVYVCEGLVATVENVLDFLFAALGEPPSSSQELLGSEDAHFQKLCARLQAAAARKKQRLWIVADDLQPGRLDPMIKRLLDQIALTMMNPSFAQWFRLVLIDYPDGAVPTRWRGLWLEDRPAEADVDASALADFLVCWGAQREKTVPLLDAQRLAAETLAKVEQPQTASPGALRRLERVHDELMATLTVL